MTWDWFNVASAQRRNKRLLSYFHYCISFGFFLNWRVIFHLFHLCKWSLVLIQLQRSTQHTHLLFRNLSLPDHSISKFSSLYLRKHPERLFKATWCISAIGRNSLSFIVCWTITKPILRSHKYARMARSLVPPPQHSCLQSCPKSKEASPCKHCASLLETLEFVISQVYSCHANSSDSWLGLKERFHAMPSFLSRK